jgi:ABC-type multidrug transport system fused ATPase/permease subunit
MKNILKRLSLILSNEDKKFIRLLLIFSVVISIIETAGVSIIMPFIAVASDFSLIETNNYYSFVYGFFNFNNSIDFIVSFGAILIGFYIFRSAINLFYFHMMSKFSQSRYHLIACRLFRSYMGMSYQNFLDKNSSELTKAIITEAQLLSGLISAILLAIGEMFIIVLIYSMMLYVSYQTTLVLTFVLGLNAFFLIKTVSKRIKKEGVNREVFQKDFYEIINSTLNNFKLIKLQSRNKDILNRFEKVSYNFSKSNITNATLGHFPRLFLEAIGFSLVAFMITFLVWQNKGDISPFLPMISMFVLGLYRLMPSVNRIMNSYNSILYSIKALDIIYDGLFSDIESLGEDKTSFKESIVLKNVSFSYNHNNILENIDWTLKKGDRIAFIGKSGSGKSTLVDIITGLYRPVKGRIEVDGQLLADNNIKDFRKKIGYIPQSVYLFDGTVAQNVTFGIDMDENKVKKVLSKANILEFLEKEACGIHTKVGEGGVKLSGGQKQRIAIARALYSDPEILVLDEATSALDTKTEAKIMREIYNLSEGKTLIIIAHRLSTLEGCKKIYEIKDKKINRVAL